MQRKIIIDTDPGIDDLLAIVFAHKSKLNVSALTTVYGNSDIHNVTKNAGYIVSMLKINCGLFKGASVPLTGPAVRAESHGESGLGSVQPNDSEIVQPENISALEFLNGITGNGHTLLCLGPLTNIALEVQEDQNFLQRFSKLIVMGGAFTEKGNVTEYAEFNFYNDPEAVAVVVESAMKHHIDMTIIPAEVCRKVLLTHKDLTQLEASSDLPNLKAIVGPFIDYYLHDKVHGGYEGAVLYDVLVPLCFTNPELFTKKFAQVKIEVDDPKRRGQTIYDEDRNSSVAVCVDVDAQKAKEIVMQHLIYAQIINSYDRLS